MTRTKISAIGKNTASGLKKPRRVSLDPLLQESRLLISKNDGSLSGFSEANTSPPSLSNATTKSGSSRREELLRPKEDGMVRISFKDLYNLETPDRDWTAFDAQTEEDIAKAVADDPDAAPIDMDWSNAVVLELMPKTAISLRVDADVYDFFKAKGKGFQTRMNAVLRAYVAHQRSLK
jgi:uncharacterized protein (DUF4415 family)